MSGRNQIDQATVVARHRRARRLASAVLLAACGLPAVGFGAAATFDGDAAINAPGDNVTWSNAANWTTGGVVDTAPSDVAPGDDLTFGNGTAGGVIDLGAARVANSITFNKNYTLGTAATALVLTDTTGNFSVASGVTGTINAVLAGTNGITLTGGGTLLLNRSTGNTFTGNISVDGAGTTLAFLGTNTSADPTALGAGAKTITLTNGGTLSLAGGTLSNPTAGSKSFVIGTGGGTINTASGQTLQLDDAGQFSGTGSLTKTGAGTLFLNNQAFTYTGTNVNINAGTIKAGANGGVLGAGNAIITIASGAAFDLQTTLGGTKPITVGGTGISNAGALIASGGTGVANGAVTLSSDASLGGNGTLTLSGIVSGGFNVTKVGTGLLVLSATNTYSGNTTITGGALRATAGTSLPTAGNLTLNGGAFETVANYTGTLGTGAGQVQLPAGNSGFSSGLAAGITVNLNSAATLVWGTTPSFSPASLILNQASAIGTLNFLNPINLNGATRTVTVNAPLGANTATLSAAITNGGAAGAGLTKSGAGVLILTSTGNTYDGTTTVAGGVLRATDGTTLNNNNLTLSGGVIEGGVNFVRPLGTAAGQVQITGGNSGFSAFGAAVTVNLGGAADPVQFGTATFSPATLVLNESTANNAITFVNPLDLNGATRSIGVNNALGANTATVSGAITNSTGTAGLTKTGAGALVLTNAANAYNGTTTISGGVLRATDGTTLPSTGNLTLNGGQFETGVNFARTLGTAAGQVQLTGGNSGFSAFGAPITVNLSSGATLVWGSATFNPTALVLNAATSNNTLDFQNPLDLAGTTRTIAGNNTANVASISGIISNSSATAVGPTINGSGIVAFTGANTYTGTTTLTAGTLSVGANNNLGAAAAPIVFSGGTLQVTGTTLTNLGSHTATFTAAKTIGFDIANAANNFTLGTTPALIAGQTLLKAGAGTLTLTAPTNTVTTLAMSGGTLDIGTTSLALSNNGGTTMNITGNSTINATGGGTLTISTAGGTNYGDNSVSSGVTLTINAKITGAGTAGNLIGFEVCCANPAGTYVLANPANDFSGDILFSQPGTISVPAITNAGVAGPLGKGSNINFNAAGARLLYTGTGDSTDRTLTLSQTAVTLEQGGTGLLKFTGTIATGGNSKTITLQGSTAGVGEIASVIPNNSATNVTSILKTGSGAWTLSGVNTFTGGVNINTGLLTATNSSSLGTGTKTITIVPVTNPTSLPGLQLDGSAGDITLPNTISFTTSFDALNGGVPIANKGAIINLAGNNTIAGNFSLTGGGGGTTFLASGGTLNLTGNLTPITTGRAVYLRGNALGVISGVIANGSTVALPVNRDAGTGIWTLSGDNTYSGGTSITSGTLYANAAIVGTTSSATGTGPVTITGTATGTAILGGTGGILGAVTVNKGGILAPGNSINTLTVASPVTFGTAGSSTSTPTYAAELQPAAAPVAGTDNDLLALTGSGTAGVLTLTNPDTLNLLPLTPITGPTTYTIATFASENGVFDNVLIGGIASQNSDPNGANYALVTYNPNDIQVTVANTSAVPEPASLGLLGLGAAGLLARRRRAAAR